jgi:hypothetical protein
MSMNKFSQEFIVSYTYFRYHLTTFILILSHYLLRVLSGSMMIHAYPAPSEIADQT